MLDFGFKDIHSGEMWDQQHDAGCQSVFDMISRPSALMHAWQNTLASVAMHEYRASLMPGFWMLIDGAAGAVNRLG